MDTPAGQITASAAIPVRSAGIPDLALIQITPQHTVIIPPLSINRHPNAIPAVSCSTPHCSHIPGYTEAGHLHRVHSIPERNPVPVEDHPVNPAPIASVGILVQPVDIPNLVLIRAVAQHIVIIPARSISEPQNVIPAVNQVPQQNRIPGRTAAGLLHQVRSTPERNPVPADDLPVNQDHTVSVETLVQLAATQQCRHPYHSPHPVPAVHSVQPVVKLLRRNIRQVTR